MNARKLQAYASLAEVVSAAAIIVSLLYVGYEFRRTGTLTSREVDVILFERSRQANRLLIEASDLADIVVTAETAPETLSPPDRRRFLAYQHDFFDSWEIAWYYREDGILDEATWSDWDEWFTTEARRRPAFAWTENRRHFTGESFRRHVDSVLSERIRSGSTDRP